MATKKTPDPTPEPAPAGLPWDVNASIHLRLLRTRADLRGAKLWSKFPGDRADRTYDAFSIHELANVCEEALANHGVTFSFSVEREQASGNFRMIVGHGIFTCAERIGDEFGDEYRVRAVGEAFDDSDKGFGKALSYARKAAMVQGLNLAIGQDNEATNSRAAPGTPPPNFQSQQQAPGYRFEFQGGPMVLNGPIVFDRVSEYISRLQTTEDVERFRDANAATINAYWEGYDRNKALALKQLVQKRINELNGVV